jgi:hypothetical protein
MYQAARPTRVKQPVAMIVLLGVLAVGCSGSTTHATTGAAATTQPKVAVRCPARPVHNDVGSSMTEFMQENGEAYNKVLVHFETHYPDDFMGVETRSSAGEVHIGFRFFGAFDERRAELATLAPGLPFTIVQAFHSPAELRAAVDQLNASRVRPGTLEVSPGMPYVALGLPPGSESLADTLLARHGELLRIEIAGRAYIPTGCDEPKPVVSCPPLTDTPLVFTSTVAFGLEVQPTLRQDLEGEGTLVIYNTGNEAIAGYGSGSGGSGIVLDRTTRLMVGAFGGSFTADLHEWRIEPGATLRFPFRYSAAACGGESASLPPGEYLVSIGFAYGPASATAGPAGLSQRPFGVMVDAPFTIVAP